MDTPKRIFNMELLRVKMKEEKEKLEALKNVEVVEEEEEEEEIIEKDEEEEEDEVIEEVLEVPEVPEVCETVEEEKPKMIRNPLTPFKVWRYKCKASMYMGREWRKNPGFERPRGNVIKFHAKKARFNELPHSFEVKDKDGNTLVYYPDKAIPCEFIVNQ